MLQEQKEFRARIKCHALLCGAAILTTCFFNLSPAWAQTSNGPKAPEQTKKSAPQPPAKYEDALMMFDSFDINKDGVLEDHELSRAVMFQFKKKDLNGDGKLTPFENGVGTYEFEEKIPKNAPTDLKGISAEKLVRYERWFSMVDINGDGIITEYENLRFFRDVFKDIDKENIGKTTREEYIQYLEKTYGP